VSAVQRLVWKSFETEMWVQAELNQGANGRDVGCVCVCVRLGRSGGGGSKVENGREKTFDNGRHI
jgi:hypothetical protein